MTPYEKTMSNALLAAKTYKEIHSDQSNEYLSLLLDTMVGINELFLEKKQIEDDKHNALKSIEATQQMYDYSGKDKQKKIDKLENENNDLNKKIVELNQLLSEKANAS